MLDPFSRGAIIALTALCAAGAVALAPLRARSSIDADRLHTATLPARAATPTVVALPIERDPFSEPNAAATVASPAGAIAGTVVLRQLGGGALPSNLASDTIPAIPGTPAAATDPLTGMTPGQVSGGSRITAIVTGAHPYAMVETGGVHEIKGIGDRIAGLTISSIDIGGIRLQNGARLSVDAAGRP